MSGNKLVKWRKLILLSNQVWERRGRIDEIEQAQSWALLIYTNSLMGFLVVLSIFLKLPYWQLIDFVRGYPAF